MFDVWLEVSPLSELDPRLSIFVTISFEIVITIREDNLFQLREKQKRGVAIWLEYVSKGCDWTLMYNCKCWFERDN